MRSWDLKPDLMECMLEDRIVPAGPMNNLGIIIQTTSGLALVTPFPGAINMAAMAGGSSGSVAQSVSGTLFPTGIYLTGTRGISSMMPGNMTGNPAVLGVLGPNGGVNETIEVGSGAEEASGGGGGSTTPAMSRTNPAYGGATSPIMAYIGSLGQNSSGMTTANNGQVQTTAPVPALPPMGTQIPGTPGSPPGQADPGQSQKPMGPQLGAPRMIKGLGTSLIPSLPGGLGIGGTPSMSPSGAGGY